MITLLKTFAIPVLLTLSIQASAHEGHDHGAPKNIQAPKAGVIKSFDDQFVEVVNKGADLKVYFYDKDLKAMNSADFKVKGHAKLPRSKKQEEIKFTYKDQVYEGQFDAKGSHRYTLTLSFVVPQEGHNEEIDFTIEPKK